MNSLPHTGREKTDNPLWDYVQSLSPEAIAKLSQPNPEVAQVMERSIAGMLGTLPPEGFDVAVTTSRENLSKLLVSAMMNGYFLNSAHQRMAFDRSLQAVHTDDDPDSHE
ncbi:MAG: DUF760 domain-containing protein [Sodalinema sp.]|uniref:DUF760 domain-containing protein n=1 Tax=Sodalinema sp. TaxID=3080550 RepID=UPI00396F4D19